MLRRRAVAGVTGKMLFRNGTDSRKMLPLWNGNGILVQRFMFFYKFAHTINVH